MFESHFGLRENPFVSGHQSRFVYPSREHQEALAHLRYGIENLEPFVLITGEVGTGKTTALFEAIGELKARVSVALITNSALTRDELIEEICLRFGITLPQPITKPQALAQLERHLLALRGRGERAILLIDEAQNFDRELLEEVRLLSNLEASGEKLVQVFLVGQPELEMRLSATELRQLRQRIAVHYRLRPLDREETAQYIHHRVVAAGGDAARIFPGDTCQAVHDVTNGVPREINQICAQAMIDAFVEGAPAVTPAHVRAAAQEASFQSVLPAAETDPRLAPLPAWPAAIEPPAPRTPAPAPFVAPTPAPAPFVAPTPAPAPFVAPTLAPAPFVAPTPVEPTFAPAEPEPPARTRYAVEPDAPAPTAPTPAEPEPEPAREIVIPAASHEASGATDDPQATRWEAWVASLVKQSEAEVAAAREQRSVSPGTPEALAAPAAPVTPAAPGPSEASAEPEPPARTRYAAETAVVPPATEKPVADWRPPMWSPDRDADHEVEETHRGGNLALRLMAGVAIVAVLGVSGVMLFRMAPWRAKAHIVPAAAVPAESSATFPTADTTSTMEADTARLDSSHAAAVQPPISAPTPAAPRAAALPPPRSASAAPAAGSPGAIHPAPATAPQPAPPVATAPTNGKLEFGVSVGAYLDRSRAQTEIARLTAAGIAPLRIAPVNSEGVTMHAVVVGAYATRAEAEKAANDLIARDLVDEARIINRTVPPAP
jgi:type II secretory pathway predicted ATPase ExeA